MTSCFYGDITLIGITRGTKVLILNVIRVCIIYVICHAVFFASCNLTFVHGKYECVPTFRLIIC